MSGPSDEQSRKRKLPPTFPHLPIQQAKKLKKAWVEKTKIKSKWKAEKRHLAAEQGAPTKMPWELEEEYAKDRSRFGTTQIAQEESNDEWDGIGDDKVEPSPALPETKDDGSDGESSERRSPSPQPQPKRFRYASANQNANPSAPIKSVHPMRANRKPKKVEGDKSAEALTLRDLKREAYAASSLHTFKADPLHKRRDGSHHGRGNSFSRGGNRGGDRGGNRGGNRGAGRGGPTSRGRGQPNMKLRMNVMLEEIEQGFANT
ncbi:hypothetical protein FA15DRAFT_685931 [Coprinopsis marcescibilis]|uniref:rRNA-processing protein FYV7 n=1 Tax=Coprinopsis marcescibilis TaxID=230819 RepID=A0A5C3L3T1_COPMA|nr:hypothetical protein FA15DRAFT_685931 [Coprinopsis marcescibilis]